MLDRCQPVLRLLVLLPALMLSACGSLLPEPAPPPNRFDLGPLPASSMQLTAPEGVRLHRVEAPSWLDVVDIPYRLLYRRPEAVLHYAAHTWVATPAEMLAARLEQRLATDGDASERWRLEVDLLSFEQVHASPREAQAQIRLHARLQPRSGNEGAVQRTFSAAVAVQANVDGAIEGLPRAADQALGELMIWVSETSAR